MLAFMVGVVKLPWHAMGPWVVMFAFWAMVVVSVCNDDSKQIDKAVWSLIHWSTYSGLQILTVVEVVDSHLVQLKREMFALYFLCSNWSRHHKMYTGLATLDIL